MTEVALMFLAVMAILYIVIGLIVHWENNGGGENNGE